MTMTREEAIQVLEEEAEYLYQDDRPYNREAFDMAIEALKNEPILCENCKHKRTCVKTVNMSKRDSNNNITFLVQPLDFCSCGERREE